MTMIDKFARFVLETSSPHDTHSCKQGGHQLTNSVILDIMVTLHVWVEQADVQTHLIRSWRPWKNYVNYTLNWQRFLMQCWITRHGGRRSSSRTVSDSLLAAFAVRDRTTSTGRFCSADKARGLSVPRACHRALLDIHFCAVLIHQENTLQGNHDSDTQIHVVNEKVITLTKKTSIVQTRQHEPEQR